MNNKLISYEEAVKRLKDLEIKQRIQKVKAKGHNALGISESLNMRAADKNRKAINKLLTIIHLHKQSRKLWAEKEKYKNKWEEILMYIPKVGK